MKQARVAVSIFAGLLCVAILPGSAAAQRDKNDDPTSVLNFVVLKEDNGKPVRNAAVIMHPVSSRGKQERGGLELKTDAEGKTSFDGIPYGKLRVQVLAPGYQTYGEDFDINKPKMDFTIKLKRPQSQYSIYGPGKDSSTPPKQDAPPPDKNQKPN